MAGDTHQKRTVKETVILRNMVFKVLRFWNNEVLTNIEGVLEIIMKNCLSPSQAPPVKGGGVLIYKDMRTLFLGYSPCPNDTFIFYALVHGKIDAGGLQFKEILLDVETLNQMAVKGELDITKASYNAFGNLREDYCLLRSGGALGRGCGPLVVASKECEMKDLKGKTIAIPGELTTAYLLLQLYDPDFRSNVKAMPFHEIMEAVKKERLRQGL